MWPKRKKRLLRSLHRCNSILYYIRGEKLEINSLVIFKNHVCTFQTYLVILRKKIFKYLTSSLVPVRGLAIVVKLEGVKQGWAIERGARGIGGARPCKLDCNVHKYSTNENWFWCGAINNPLPFSPPLLASHCRASFNECKNAETGKAA